MRDGGVKGGRHREKDTQEDKAKKGERKEMYVSFDTAQDTSQTQ